MLDLDLIGAINDYRFKLTFSEDGKSLKASLTERTGLTDEQFQGVLSQEHLCSTTSASPSANC